MHARGTGRRTRTKGKIASEGEGERERERGRESELTHARAKTRDHAKTETRVRPEPRYRYNWTIPNFHLSPSSPLLTLTTSFWTLLSTRHVALSLLALPLSLSLSFRLSSIILSPSPSSLRQFPSFSISLFPLLVVLRRLRRLWSVSFLPSFSFTPSPIPPLSKSLCFPCPREYYSPSGKHRGLLAREVRVDIGWIRGCLVWYVVEIVSGTWIKNKSTVRKWICWFRLDRLSV